MKLQCKNLDKFLWGLHLPLDDYMMTTKKGRNDDDAVVISILYMLVLTYVRHIEVEIS
jgi:hypothetical protein